MSDKLKQGISVEIEFTEGETPSPAKLTAISAQMKYASSQLEKAVGDIHGDSYPYLPGSSTTLSLPWSRSRVADTALGGVAERKLDIANLARLVGPASNLNPRMLAGVQSITEDIPIGVYEFTTRYPIDGIIDATNPAISDTNLTVFKSNASGLNGLNDYTVTPEGKVNSVSPTAGGTITYNTNPAAWAGGLSYTGSSFNVMPDPNQIRAGGPGVTLGALDSNARRTATLPVVTHQQSDISGTMVALDTEDINYNKQLNLPRVLIDNFSVGQQIPSGFLFLKNETTGEVYDQAEYFYNGPTSVKVGNVDLDEAINLSHQFSIITVGNDITSAIDDLRTKTFHTHDRSFGEPFVDVNGIGGILTEAGNKGSFVPSEIPGNFAPQYLHRDGYTPGVDSSNINDSNALRGHLMLGISGASPGSYVVPNSEAETYKIMFGGNGSDDAFIHRNSAGNLVVYNGGNGDIVLSTPGLLGFVEVTDSPLRLYEGLTGNPMGLYTPSLWSSFGKHIGADMHNAYNLNVIVPAAVQSKDTIHLTIAVKPGSLTSTDTWYPSNDGAWKSFTGTLPDFSTYTYWTKSGSTTNYFVVLTGGGWATESFFNYRMMIWYQP